MNLDSLLGSSLKTAQELLNKEGFGDIIIIETSSPKGKDKGDDVRVLRAVIKNGKPELVVAKFKTKPEEINAP